MSAFRRVRVRALILGAIAPLYVGTPNAIAADGVTGLLADVTPLLSVAGAWRPVDNQYVTTNCSGGLAGTFADTFTTDSSGREHLVITGWQYCGFNNTATSITPVRIAMFRQQSDGTLRLDTSSFVTDPLTNGGSSVVVADFNGDGYSDIFLAAHNESPFIGMPSTALLSNGTGSFNKVTLNDHVMAHDAQLAIVNGKPTVFTRTYTNGGADSNPYYQFVNGAFVATFAPGISGEAIKTRPSLTGQSGAVGQFASGGAYEILDGDATFVAGAVSTSERMIVAYPFNGFDAVIAQQVQRIPAYFNSRAQYANISSFWGPHQTHTYRLKVDDFNHDGALDVIGLEGLWDGSSDTFPSALQMLQNDGTGKFQDVSDTLAASVNPQNSESDYEFRVRDLDNSQVGSYLSAAQFYATTKPNTTNYLLVNDGSGALYVALREKFDTWSVQINAYLTGNTPSGYFCPPSNSHLKFIPYKTANGKLNYLALNFSCITNTQVNGRYPAAYVFVNLPIQIDLSTMMKTPMTVQNRNGSHLIRTFAGDDVIYSGNSGGYAHIDGGLGTNKVIYSGPRANYDVSQNDDGSWAVADKVGSDGIDTLVRIQSAQFTDTTVALSSTAPARVQVGAVFSSVHPLAGSFIRLFNTGSTAGTATVTLRNSTTGATLGSWPSPSIPSGSEQQFYIKTIEDVANPVETKPDYYDISVQSNFTGYLQHVIYKPSTGTITNLSTCSKGMTAEPKEIAGVHSTLLASLFQSSIVVNNTNDVAQSVTLGIYDANNGNTLGTYPVASISAGAQAIIVVPDIEKSAHITPSGSQYHYVVKAEGAFTGFIQHIMQNAQSGVVTDLTTECAFQAVSASTDTSPMKIGAVFSSVHPLAGSFIRLFNTGTTAGTATVTLRNPTTGATIGSWPSPGIPSGSEQQFYIKTIEDVANPTGTKPDYYEMSVQSNFTGYLQHVIYKPSTGTVTNLSTCSKGITAEPKEVAGVHSTLLASLFQSSIVVNNSAGVAESVTLGIYDANNGLKLGSYPVSAIAAGAQAIIAVPDIEASAHITPSGTQYHYVVKAEGAFTGFIQHVMNNTQSGVVTDMTTECAF